MHFQFHRAENLCFFEVFPAAAIRFVVNQSTASKKITFRNAMLYAINNGNGSCLFIFYSSSLSRKRLFLRAAAQPASACSIQYRSFPLAPTTS
jgi:hypothetical protein